MSAVVMPYAPRAGAAPRPMLEDKPAIDWERFILPNGLTVIVHENRAVPLVTVNIWYKVGAKDEPSGKTGLAHLFEHLMFGGSAHMPGSYIENMGQVGAIDLNGTTNPDRTNFYQTVETGALDAALFAESDRMGHFLETLESDVLERQRGVVLNEKDQTEGGPHGGTPERILRGLYPIDHPYAHTTIGWREDVEALTLEDARDWFRKHYGPSNAVLVLAGDIDVATARAKALEFFGDIPPGPPQIRPGPWIPAPRGERREVVEDRVPHARVTMAWHAPPAGDPASTGLSLALPTLGQGRLSRLYRRLVEQDGLATDASANLAAMMLTGRVTVTATLADGADIAALEAAMRDEVARFCTEGIGENDLKQARVADEAGLIRHLQTSQSVADLLAMNEVYFGDPGRWQAEMEWIAGIDLAEVSNAVRTWLDRAPDFVLHTVPYGEPRTEGAGFDRRQPPRLSSARAIALPPTREGRLSNGARVIVAERHDVPLVEGRLIVPRGTAVEPSDRAGAAELIRALLGRGAGTRDAAAVRDIEEANAIDLRCDIGSDFSGVSLSALRSRLDLALDLHADRVRRPLFDDEEIEGLRARALIGLRDSGQQASTAVAAHLLRRLIFGKGHPYARVEGGRIDTVSAIGRDHLVALHERIFDSADATFVFVGDTDLDEMLPKLEARYGDWPTRAQDRRLIPPACPAEPGIHLIDRPGSPQSFVAAALVIPPPSEIDPVALPLVHSVLGGTFGSRLNMNLREEKNWTYGVNAEIGATMGDRLYVTSGAFQTDRTADSMIEIAREYRELVTTNPISPEMLPMMQQSMIQGLPQLMQTLGSVVEALATIVTHDLPLDFWSGHAERIDAMDAETVNALARLIIRPERLVWVVVGDRAMIEADVRRAGLGPVHIVATDNDLLYR